MSDTLPVAVNRRELHDLAVPASFETDDSFVIAVENSGEAVRVHVHLDEGLSQVADVETANHYVEANGRTEIPVSVHGAGPAFGKIKIVAGYGATTRWVDVTIEEAEDSGVVVDEDLAKPTPPEERDDDPTTIGAIADHPSVPLVGLAAVAVLVAVVAAITFRSQVVVAGASIVVLAVIAAAYQLFR